MNDSPEVCVAAKNTQSLTRKYVQRNVFTPKNYIRSILVIILPK